MRAVLISGSFSFFILRNFYNKDPLCFFNMDSQPTSPPQMQVPTPYTPGPECFYTPEESAQLIQNLREEFLEELAAVEEANQRLNDPQPEVIVILSDDESSSDESSDEEEPEGGSTDEEGEEYQPDEQDAQVIGAEYFGYEDDGEVEPKKAKTSPSSSTAAIAKNPGCHVCIDPEAKAMFMFYACGHMCLCSDCVEPYIQQCCSHRNFPCPMCRVRSYIAPRKVFY